MNHFIELEKVCQMDTASALLSGAIVFATFVGPIAAVQAQKWIERKQQQKNRRIEIFRTLMATRAATLDPAHVKALNVIPIEFYEDRFKDVMEARRSYIDYLSQKGIDPNVWMQKRHDLLPQLLLPLSDALGYHFTDVELQREIYSPVAHATLETQNQIIRDGLTKLFSGEAVLPLDIKTFPADQQFIKRQNDLAERFLSWLEGQRTVQVEVRQPTPPARA